MRIQSNSYQCPFKIEEIQKFISNTENLEKLLPTDRISEFTSDANSCSFKIQGGIVISLVRQTVENNRIEFVSGPEAPFPFTLNVHLQEANGQTTGRIEFEGDAPPFVAMIAERPLTNLFNHMSETLTTALKNP